MRDGGAQGRHTDSATLRLTRASDGKCCKVQASYLSGADEIRLPEIDDARSNPVLLFFLEHEVRALQRITKGQASHFRKRIRQALVDNAKVTSTTIRWNGQELPAREIRISPYLDDPFRARFEKQATKVYVFVVSDAVPGGIYRMAAELPGADESLTLEDRQDGK